MAPIHRRSVYRTPANFRCSRTARPVRFRADASCLATRLLLLLALLASAVLNAPAPAALPAGREPSAAEEADSKYLRFVPDSSGVGGTLQASTVRFQNKDGVVVDLVAAVHIAEASYFRGLEESFPDYDALLFEMVAPRAMLEPIAPGSSSRRLVERSEARTAATRKSADGSGRGRALGMVGTLQKFLRDTLKLSFQLEAIDYWAPNFIHADLDAETFDRLQTERGESLVGLMLNSMVRQMADPKAHANSVGLPELLYAMQSADKARQLKLVLARQFNQIDRQMSGLDGPNGSVILSERNKVALAVLKEQLAEADRRTLAIFFGAGHLKGMEKILVEDMGFRQVGPPFWRVAWDMIEPAGSSSPNSTSGATTRPSGAVAPATRRAMAPAPR